jgi:hypothetical protein
VTALARLTRRDRRALLLGALALGPVLLFRGVAQPYARARAALTERLATERGLLERELTLLAAARRLPERREHLAALLAADARTLFPGGDPLAATAELVGYVGGAARGSRVLVQELQSRGATPVPGGDRLVQLEVEVRGQTDLEGALRLLDALERGPRLVRVDALVLEQATVLSRGPETLTLRAVVAAFAAAVPAPGGRMPLRPVAQRTSR